MTLKEAQQQVDQWINPTGIDLTEAFNAGMTKRSERDATRHLNNPKLSD